jgi:hypothetical protein
MWLQPVDATLGFNPPTIENKSQNPSLHVIRRQSAICENRGGGEFPIYLMDYQPAPYKPAGSPGIATAPYPS